MSDIDQSLTDNVSLNNHKRIKDKREIGNRIAYNVTSEAIKRRSVSNYIILSAIISTGVSRSTAYIIYLSRQIDVNYTYDVNIVLRLFLISCPSWFCRAVIYEMTSAIKIKVPFITNSYTLIVTLMHANLNTHHMNHTTNTRN